MQPITFHEYAGAGAWIELSCPMVRPLTNRSTGRMTRLSRGLRAQPARQPLCAGELNR